MDYVELLCKIIPYNEEINDIVTAGLIDYGFESFVNTDFGLKAYIPSNQFDFNQIDEKELCQNQDFNISLSYNVIPDQNWNELWEKNYFKPIFIGNRCLIKSPFHDIDKKAEYTILIEPKMSFGTGHHDTTSQMIEQVLDKDLTNKKILDMGCGTGVLAILCAMKGAGEIWAVDNDEWAYNNTIENAMNNNTDNVSVVLGDIDVLDNQKFDLILANINRNTLLKDMKQYAEALNKNGELIISGFYKEDIEILTEEAKEYKLFDKKTTNHNKWALIVFGKEA